MKNAKPVCIKSVCSFTKECCSVFSNCKVILKTKRGWLDLLKRGICSKLARPLSLNDEPICQSTRSPQPHVVLIYAKVSFFCYIGCFQPCQWYAKSDGNPMGVVLCVHVLTWTTSTTKTSILSQLLSHLVQWHARALWTSHFDWVKFLSSTVRKVTRGRTSFLALLLLDSSVISLPVELGIHHALDWSPINREFQLWLLNCQTVGRQVSFTLMFYCWNDPFYFFMQYVV